MQKGRGGCESWVNITLHVSLCLWLLPPKAAYKPGTSELNIGHLKVTLIISFKANFDKAIYFALWHWLLKNHFISGRWGIPRTRPWRSFDWSCWRRIPAIFGCNMIWNFDCVKCRWHIVTLWLLSGSGLRLGLELPHDNSFGAQSQCDLDFAHTFLSVSVSF